MRSKFFTLIILFLASTLLGGIGSGVVCAQETTVGQEQSDSDGVLLRKAEEDIEKSRWKIDFAIKAHWRLKELLRRYPDSPLRQQAEKRLDTVDEKLGAHNLTIALYYFRRFEERKTKSLKGAESRLQHIVCEYPSFSQMDEVLLYLVRVYSVTEDAADAMQFLQQFMHKHPQDRDFKEACKELKRR